LYAHMNKIKKDTSLLLNSAGRMIYMEQWQEQISKCVIKEMKT
jgi:hypothetical protein